MPRLRQEHRAGRVGRPGHAQRGHAPASETLPQPGPRLQGGCRGTPPCAGSSVWTLRVARAWPGPSSCRRAPRGPRDSCGWRVGTPPTHAAEWGAQSPRGAVRTERVPPNVDIGSAPAADPPPASRVFSGGGGEESRGGCTLILSASGGWGGGRPLGRVTPGRHKAGPRPQHSPDCPTPGPLPSSPTARAGPSAPDPMPALPSPSCPSSEEAMTWPPAPAWGPRTPPAGAPSSTPRPGCGARGLVPWSAGCFQDVTRAPKVTVAGEPKLRRLSVATDAVPF